MSWEAANAPTRDASQTDFDDGDGLNNDENNTRRHPHKRKATETVEAALSRLSRAYSNFMECVGTLHKTDKILDKKDDLSEASIQVLETVATAARTVTEKTILLDPLIIDHAAKLNSTMHELYDETNNTSEYWKMVNEKRPPPPIFSSLAHKSTIRELAYLSLVNYADTLISCCTCGISMQSDNKQKYILDKGVCKNLKTLEKKNCCCWKGESHEHTQRLAVTALCDATKLDGSDPTVWLKLACAARGLERIKENENQSILSSARYRRLERFALEKGSCCLPPTMPPNRLVILALQQLNEQSTPSTYTFETKPVEREELVLDLPRYSWSVLGRMLMKACREGNTANSDPKQKIKLTQRNQFTHFGSPSIVMHLSPMLVLPPKVLGKICQYLENSSIWRFEATCKALSVTIIAARALLEQESSSSSSGRNQSLESSSADKDKAAPTPPINASEAEGTPKATTEPSAPSTSTTTATKSESNQKVDKQSQSSIRKNEGRTKSHRTSKRLRSQLITSGKKAERTYRRTSVEYCFLATTMSCTADDITFQSNQKKKI